MTGTPDPRDRARRGLILGLASLAATGRSVAAGADGPSGDLPGGGAGGEASALRLAQWPHGGASPDFSLVDQDGHPRTLADYRGRVVVVFFGFVHCPDVCPAALFRLALAMRQLGAQRAAVQVLFVTLDPQRDTVATLGPYVRAFDGQFAGLTGTAGQVDAAASRFFVQYARVGRGDRYSVDHSTLLYVIDRTGRLRAIGRSDGPTEDLVHDLRILAAETPAAP